MNILIVVVLYKMNLHNSPTYNSLLEAFDIVPEILLSNRCIIYDNSPDSLERCTENSFRYEYVHNPENGGLAVAYNYALEIAVANNYDWILLLDQDTIVTAEFLRNNVNHLKKICVDETIVALIPQVICDEQIISPSQNIYGKKLNSQNIGICDFSITAINSGSFIKTSFMQQIGGFNKKFKLDFLDHWLFHTIYSCGKKVFISETIIQHELSVTDFNKYISTERYRNILKAEALFFRLYKSRIDNLLYIIRILGRVVKKMITARNKYIGLVVLKHFIYTIGQMVLKLKNDENEQK